MSNSSWVISPSIRGLSHLTPFVLFAAGAIGAPNASAAPLPESAYEQLFAFARANVVETTTPLALYHWNSRESFTSLDEYLKYSMGDTFEYAGKQNNYMGDGFYLATDPIVTRDFAGDSWGLLEVLLKPKRKLLDLRGDTQKIAPALRDAIRAAVDCPIIQLRDLFYLGQYRGCYDLRVRILRDPRFADVPGVVYTYPSVGFFRCYYDAGKKYDVDSRMGEAFYVWDRSAFEGLQLLTANEVDAGEDVGRVQALFQEMRARSFSPDYNGEMPLPKATLRPSPSALLDWMKSYLWGCRPGL